jgi:hypothetical protein
MTKREQAALVSRMVSMARTVRLSKGILKEYGKDKAAGLMLAARMVKGHATQARYELRRAA